MSYKKNDNIVSILRLQELINESDMTREEIANKLNIGASTVTQYYNGNRNLTVEAVKKFAKLFNVSTDYLFGLTEAKTTDTSIKAICDYIGLNDEAVETLHLLNSLLDNFPKTIEEIKGFDEFVANNSEEIADNFMKFAPKIRSYDNVKFLLADYLDDCLNECCNETESDLRRNVTEMCVNILSFYNRVITSTKFQLPIKDLAFCELLSYKIIEDYTKNPSYYEKKMASSRYGIDEINETYLRMYECKDDFNKAIFEYLSDTLEVIIGISEKLFDMKNKGKTGHKGISNGNDNETK